MPRGRPRSRAEDRQGHRRYRDEELAAELSKPVPLERGVVIPAPPAPPEGGQLRAETLVLWDRYWLSHLPRALDAQEGVDRRVVHEWILAFDELQRLQELAASSPLVRGSTGQLVLNPLYRRIDRLLARIDVCEQKLGANPRDRMRLGIAAGTAAITALALDELLDDDDAGGEDVLEARFAPPREGEPTLRELRELARLAKIPKYSRMTKAQLLEAVLG